MNPLKISINYTYYPDYFTDGKLNEHFFYNIDSFIEDILTDSNTSVFKTKAVRNILNSTKKKKNLCLELRFNRDIKFFVFDAEINTDIHSRYYDTNDDTVYINYGAKISNANIVYKDVYDKYLKQTELELS